MPYSALEAKEIATLCTVVDCEHKTAPYVEKSDYLVVRTSNVRNGQLLMEDMKYTTVDGYNEWTQRAVPAYGDVLFTREAPAGESCLVPHDKKVCMGQRMVMLRPNKDVTDPIFLSLILNTERTKTDISRLSIGSTVSRINIADIKKLKVASPPLQEQRKIAQILSTWDRGIATTEKLIDASKQQKKALMQQLLTGKKRLVDPETGKAFEGEWEEVKLGDICDVKGGKRLPKGESLQTNANKHPYIRVTDMFMGGVDCTNLLYVPENIAPSIAKYTINSNDLFITVAGTLGIIGKIPSILDGANLTENADKLTNIKCNQIFLMYILMSPIIQQYIDSESTQNAQPKLALARIRSFSLLLPIDQEQQKIASVLIAADKEIELLKAKLAHFKQEKKALMQQLLTGKRRVSLSS